MKINIEQQNFLPHCTCRLELHLVKDQVNLIKGMNGVGKSTLAKFIKEQHFDKVTLIEQSPLTHFYDRTLNELKTIFIQSRPKHFDESTLSFLWQAFSLDHISFHSVKKLSGGENQSLKLSFGLSIKNKILILDEPSQYLDIERRKKLSSILEKLMNDHFIVVIEHDSSWLSNLPKQTTELYIEDSILKARRV